MATTTRALPSPSELQGRWHQALEEANLRPKVLEVLDRYPEERSVTLPFPSLEATDPTLADLLLEQPEEMLEIGRRAMRELLPVAGPEADQLRLRITELPVTVRRTIREIRETDLGHFIALDAIVRKTTEVRPQIRDAVFLCLACKNDVHEVQEDWAPVFHEPLECTHCGKPASRTRFRLVPERSTYLDSQRIEIQENPEKLKGGAHPQGLAVLLTEDLTGHVIPGNRVVLNGILRGLQRASASRAGVVRSTTFDLLLVGNSIEFQQREYADIPLSEEDETLIRSFRDDPQVLDRIVLSLAPTIKGMEEEKEAIALQLFGGVEKRHPDGIRVRGDIHCLLVGDPGTAKSQLLRYIADVAPRGVYTSGKGATAAGLTAAAVKDDFGGGRWVLEAGMLVLADGGIAVVDELDKMTPEDRSAMHEALEQQSYHPGFEIMLSNGERREIGPWVDSLFDRFPERIVAGNRCEILGASGMGLSLLSTDFRSVGPVPVDRVSRHVAPPSFVRITFANGRSVTVTPEHPMFVWKGDGWGTQRADAVAVGALAPGARSYPRTLNEAVLVPPRELHGRKPLRLPVTLDPGFCRLLGYLVSEGHVPDLAHSRPAEISIWNTDGGIRDDAAALFRSCFGVEPYIQVQAPERRRRATRPIYGVRAVSVDLLHYFQANFPELTAPAARKRLPPSVFHASEEGRIELMLGAFRGDGFVDANRFGLTTASEGLARDYADLLLSLGIYAYLAGVPYPLPGGRRGTLYKVVVSGSDSRRRFYDVVGRRDARAGRLRRLADRSARRPMDPDLVPREVADRLKRVLSSIGLDTGLLLPESRGGSRPHRVTFTRWLTRAREGVEERDRRLRSSASARQTRRAYRVPVRVIARRLHRSVAWVMLHDRDTATPQGRALLKVARDEAQRKREAVRGELARLTATMEQPFRFLPVTSVERVPNPGHRWVYDVTVEPTHTFLTEGLVLHNTVSVAKAGITATLNARCPVLAAANPKFGRFTPDRTISEQIDLPPTLLSRFDVIFSIQDRPNSEKDRTLANRILQSHQEGEARGTPVLSEIATRSDAVPFPPEFLRKYIAYARRTTRPVLTDEALQVLEDFYVRVRKQGEEPNAPVPITARQLEALVRLSEASARARLANRVTLADAERATRIVESFLKRVATQEGKLDIDAVTTGVTHSQRERAELLMEIMRSLQDRAGSFTLDEVKALAERQGITAGRVDALFLTYRNQGELVETRPGTWQLIRF